VRERSLGVVVALVMLADIIAIPFVGHAAKAKTPPAAAALPTTTVAPRLYAFPLTGQTTTQRPQRPALSVKIDNAADALPQSGLNDADIVTEELVEGGLTRLMATFESRDAKVVGPIRSARPEDPLLLDELGGGLFAFSGASAAVLADVQANSGALLLGPVAGDPTWYRAPGRRAPGNLFSSTAGLYAQGARDGRRGPPPPQLFSYAGSPPGTAVAAQSANVAFSGTSSAAWTWIPSARAYARTQDGAPDVLADGSRVSTINVVILSVAVTASGNYDVLHNPTPLEVLTGTGKCWVLRSGVMIPGQWQRPSASTPLQLIDESGATIALRPGRTWIELVPQGMTPTFT
jgi:hypothetical protein